MLDNESKNVLLQLYLTYNLGWSPWKDPILGNASQFAKLRDLGLIDWVSLDDIPEKDGLTISYKVTSTGKEALEEWGLITLEKKEDEENGTDTDCLDRFLWHSW